MGLDCCLISLLLAIKIYSVAFLTGYIGGCALSVLAPFLGLGPVLFRISLVAKFPHKLLRAKSRTIGTKSSSLGKMFVSVLKSLQ